MAQISTVWTKHLKSEKDKEDFVTSLKGQTYITSRLVDILEENLDGILRSEIKQADFEDAAWAYKQAFRNGKKAALKEVLDLFDFLRKD
jgi:hypothetical protein